MGILLHICRAYFKVLENKPCRCEVIFPLESINGVPSGCLMLDRNWYAQLLKSTPIFFPLSSSHVIVLTGNIPGIFTPILYGNTGKFKKVCKNYINKFQNFN